MPLAVKIYASHRHRMLSVNILWTLSQDSWNVDAHQTDMARDVWQQVSQELGSIQTERAAILHRMQQCSSQPLAWRSHAPAKAAGSVQLLEQAAELSKNALLHQEVLRHATRTLTFQICSPDTMARIASQSCPAFPDLLGILKAMAAMSRT